MRSYSVRIISLLSRRPTFGLGAIAEDQADSAVPRGAGQRAVTQGGGGLGDGAPRGSDGHAREAAPCADGTAT